MLLIESHKKYTVILTESFCTTLLLLAAIFCFAFFGQVFQPPTTCTGAPRGPKIKNTCLHSISKQPKATEKPGWSDNR